MSEKLYKYRSWADSKQRLALTHGLLWFSSPSAFNDPFDCTIPMRYDLCSEEGLSELLRDMGGESFPPHVLEEKIRGVLRSHPLRIGTDTERQQQYAAHIARSYGVLSFARVLDNILLWSHYADCHRGYCIEYDRKRLDLFFEVRRQQDPERNIIAPFEVKYVDKYPILIPSKETWSDQIDEILTTKSLLWKYESEFRYIWARYNNRSIYVDKSVVTGIYIGCERRDEKAIIDSAVSNYPGVPVYLARKDPESFGLLFDSV